MVSSHYEKQRSNDFLYWLEEILDNPSILYWRWKSENENDQVYS